MLESVLWVVVNQGVDATSLEFRFRHSSEEYQRKERLATSTLYCCRFVYMFAFIDSVLVIHWRRRRVKSGDSDPSKDTSGKCM